MFELIKEALSQKKLQERDNKKKKNIKKWIATKSCFDIYKSLMVKNGAPNFLNSLLKGKSNEANEIKSDNNNI